MRFATAATGINDTSVNYYNAVLNEMHAVYAQSGSCIPPTLNRAASLANDRGVHIRTLLASTGCRFCGLNLGRRAAHMKLITFIRRSVTDRPI